MTHNNLERTVYFWLMTVYFPERPYIFNKGPYIFSRRPYIFRQNRIFSRTVYFTFKDRIFYHIIQIPIIYAIEKRTIATYLIIAPVYPQTKNPANTSPAPIMREIMKTNHILVEQLLIVLSSLRFMLYPAQPSRPRL